MMARPSVRDVRRAIEGDSICFKCCANALAIRTVRQSQRSPFHTKRKLHAAFATDRVVCPQTFIDKYFSTNIPYEDNWKRKSKFGSAQSAVKSSTLAASQPSAEPVQPQEALQSKNITEDAAQPLPRRRRRRKDEDPTDVVIPPDASSQLTTAATSLPTSASLRRKVATYLSLTKPRLSFLMTLTATTSYSIYPVPDILSSSATDLSTTTLTFLWLTTGTFLSSSCANTLNMAFEPQYDSKMSRTRNRPLVRKLVTHKAAYTFAFLTGTSGLALLFFGTNLTVSALSGLTIFLYAGVYTPMKRLSVVNTWVGAIVGAIPPMMGWVAAAGQTATLEHHSWQDLLFSSDSIGGWLLAGLLYAWQFPHFNALSHTIRDEYRNAGYRMLAWTNPAANARVALRYSIALFPICTGLWYIGVVNPGFLLLSGVCNLWMTREAIKFWRKAGGGGSARGLFWSSIWHLPLVMVGGLLCKTGIWDGLWDKGVETEEELDDFLEPYADGSAPITEPPSQPTGDTI
ncbi:putative protoheme ix farnesyltransferase [Phaeomoniella chlamydospora]|uniref:Protoheme IX farnesyltransferase, mitochondrial n=1 Tax=Phaeomoniella chlamydospora TaxID=158046 RepID=A0A0G2H998_PHACM|nr:putative protoheme ix farnesyltransferase [Phaeomoniella chlamydospora]